MKSKSSNSSHPLPQPKGPEGGLLYWLMPVAILVVAGITLVLRESEMLWRAQELSLWLPTELYWNTLMQYPGGAVSWLACYLTQYFYYPWLGTLIMCGLWLVICLLLAWEYRLRGPWLWLTVLVPLALLACVTQTGYWIYYQKLQGHLFVPTVGVLFAALCMAVPRLAESHLSSSSARWVRLGWLMIVCLAGYPFFGAWALGATALVASLPGTQPAPTWRGPVVITSFTLLLIGAIPQIYYQGIFEMTQRAYVYVAAMPSMRYSSDSFEIYRLPYYAIILAFVLIILASRYGKALAQRFASGAKSYMPAAVIIILICLAVVGVNAVWYRDVNFQKELAMNHAIDDLDWDRVLEIAREPADKKPTRQIVMFKNLALFRLGRAGDEMFLYPEGAEKQNAPWQLHMTQVGGKQIYYHYGKENFCYRWCMEDGVEFGWKLELLKFMARNSLLNHEWEVARKYLNLIRKTTFGAEWADHYAALLNNHDALDLEKVEASIKAGKPILSERDTEEFLPIMHLMTYPDRLDGDNTLVEMYLLNTFAKGNGDDKMFQEMTLLCALIMKDIDLFWPRFMKYATLNPEVHMPRYYQEAAYLYGHLENKVDISHMPFDQSIRDTYDRFMQFNTQCGAMSEEQKAVAFAPMFGDTFFYFYFLVRNQKTN